MRTASVSNVKSLFAKLLAGENITVEHKPGATTASFDTVSRVLTLPVWQDMSADLYDLFVAHEVGHALYTPADPKDVQVYIDQIDPVRPRLVQSYMNCIEDVRIENKIKDKYPGLRRQFVSGYKELMELNSQVKASLSDMDKLPLIDRVNIHFKFGLHVDVPFAPSEASLVAQVDACRTFADVARVTKAILDYERQRHEQSQEKKKSQPQPKNPGNKNKGSGQAQSSSGGNQSGGSGQTEQNSIESLDDPEDNSSQSGGESGEDISQDGSESGSSGGESGEDSSDNESQGDNESQSEDEPFEAPAPTIQDSMTEAQSAMVDGTVRNVTYLNIPNQMECTTYTVDYKEIWTRFRKDQVKMVPSMEDFDSKNLAALNQFDNETRGIVSYMVQQFNLLRAADQYKRTSSAKTGRLDMSKLSSYQTSEDLFLRNAVVADGKNHGMLILVDWSGSMDGILGDTLRQMLNITSFCRKAGIPFEVYGFSDRYAGSPAKIRDGWTPVVGDLNPNRGFRLLNFLSSRMKAAEYKAAAMNIMGLIRRFDGNRVAIPNNLELGGTPLNSAILALFDEVPAFRAKNNLQIVSTVILTDGEATDMNYCSYNASDRIFLRDPKNKTQVAIDRNSKSTETDKVAPNMTAGLLGALATREGVHSVGFYLTEKYTAESLLRGQTGGKKSKILKGAKIQTQDPMETLKESGFGIKRTAGFHEYFIVDTARLSLTKPKALPAAGATSDQITQVFTDNAVAEKNSRLLLNRFVALISGKVGK